MTRNRRVALAAWTGLISIWLALVAPVITQCLARHELAQPDTTLCSANASKAAGSGTSDDSGPHGHQPNTCGYCNLLAHHPPLAGLAFARWIPTLPSTHEIEYPVTVDIARAPFFVASPRGPPLTVF